MQRTPGQDNSSEQSLFYLVRPAAGGMRSHLQELLEHFGRLGPVHLAAPPGCGLEPHASRWGVSCSGITLAPGLNPAADIGAFRRLLSELQARRPALLHVHGLKAALLGLPAAAIAGVPALVTVHNFPAHRGGALLPVFLRAAASGGVRFIAVSRALALETIRWGIDPARVTVIHNGIDPSPYDRAARAALSGRGNGREEETSLLVGTVARMAPQKGLTDLIHAAALLAPVFPQMRFMLAGDGPERATLRQLARRLGLESRVSLPGYCEDLPRCLEAIDIFVLPSLSEGLSITLLEAMAAGRAVVAAAVGGIPEVITGEADGLLVRPGTPGALAGAVAALARDPARRLQMGRVAAVKVRSSFSRERMLAQTGAVYSRILESARANAY